MIALCVKGGSAATTKFGRPVAAARGAVGGEAAGQRLRDWNQKIATPPLGSQMRNCRPLRPRTP